MTGVKQRIGKQRVDEQADGIHRATCGHDGAEHAGFAGDWRGCATNATDRVIRWSTALAVVSAAVVAAVVSYEHVSALVRAPRLGTPPDNAEDACEYALPNH